jgi:Ca2+-binding RTX toxin-like protein
MFNFRAWIRRFVAALSSALRKRRKCRRSNPFAGRGPLELLEPRIVPNTYVVTSTLDTGAVGTLRDAINQVNAGNDNTIVFNIGTSDPNYDPATHSFSINLLIALPAVTNSVTIDGASENAYLQSQYGISVSTPIVVLNGAATNSLDGLILTAGNSKIDGLVIENFASDNLNGGGGIVLEGAGATNDVIQGNYIGVGVDGSTAVENDAGILITSGASNNLIGGATVADRNVISGNEYDGIDIEPQLGNPVQSTGNIVEGNFIGTNALGAAAVGNGNDGIYIQAAGNTVGGYAAGDGNLISGNGGNGIEISGVIGFGAFVAQNNLVEGNFIGTDVTGLAALGNQGNGIRFDTNAGGNTIGGGDASAVAVIAPGVGSLLGFANAYGGNLISGNVQNGVYLDNTGAFGPANNNLIEGNFIGVGIDGKTALGNANGVLGDGGEFSNVIGGTAKGTGNVISGNTFDGVEFTDPSGIGTRLNVVEGNYIGTDSTGSFAVANLYGVAILSGASGNIVRDNVISGNTNFGVEISGVTLFSATSNNLVEGNYIGVNAAGTAAIGNGTGVYLNAGVQQNTIGGTAGGDGNVISGNTVGIEIVGPTTDNNLVEGNLIGTDRTGTVAVGNQLGVYIAQGATENIVGGNTAAARNIISGNTGQGIEIGDSVQAGTEGDVVEGNYIGTDITGTVALGNGAVSLEIDNAFGILVGGLTSTPGTGPGNVISGGIKYTNENDRGIVVTGDCNGTLIEGNILGLNAAGTAVLANSEDIFLDTAVGVTVGGTQAGSRNIISGSQGNPTLNFGMGVELSYGATDNVVQGNYIGTDITGTVAEGNENGVKIDSGASNNIIGGDAPGQGNLIDFNGDYGVDIDDIGGRTSSGNEVLGNEMYGNVLAGIALTNGATAGSTVVPYVIQLLTSSTSTTVVGSITGAANTTFDIDFFASASGSQGEYFLGSVIVETDASGVGYFKPSWSVASATNQIFTATVTSLGTTGTAATNTSPFEVLSSFTPTSHTPPTVSINGPTSIAVGVPVVFTSAVTDSNTAKPNLTYSWTVTGPGTTALNGTGFALPQTVITDQPDFTFTPSMVGTYTVQLSISDGVSIVSSNSIVVNALNLGQAVSISGLTQPTIAAGTAVELTGNYVSASGATAVSYSWSISTAGQPGYVEPGAQTFDFQEGIAGVYEVTLTVQDSNGAITSNSVFIDVVTPELPVLISIAPSPGLTDVPITAIAGGSDAGLTGPLTYQWTAYQVVYPYPSDPYYYYLQQVATQTGSSLAFTFTPTVSGTYQIALTVSDQYGDSATTEGTYQFNVNNLAIPPAVGISAPSTVSQGSSVTLTANPSTSSDSYFWSIYNTDTGTTISGSGAQFTFIASSAGTDVVTLTATNSSGVATATSDITVTPYAAQLEFDTPVVNSADSPATLGAFVQNPGSGVTYTFTWDVIGLNGGINPTSTATTSNLVFTPDEPGTYVVLVTATGSNGDVLTAQERFTVKPVVPSVTIDALIAPTTYQQPAGAVYAGTFVSYSADVSKLDAATGSLNYAWTITGPGGFSVSGNGPSIDFTPAQQGMTYTVKVVVSDDYGYSATATTTLKVATSQPTVAILYDSAASTSSTQVLTASVTDPGSSGSYGYQWYLNGVLSNQTGANFSISASVSQLAGDTVKVVVTDNFSNTTTTTTSFQVAQAGADLMLSPIGITPGTQVMAFALGGATIDARLLPSTISVVEVALGGNDTLYGGGGNSVLQGDSGSNSLIGGSGADTLIATNNDTLIGGTGSSNLFSINPGAGEVVTAGTSNNILSFASTTTGVNVNLTSGTQTIAAGDTLSLSGTFQALIGGGGNDELSIGSNSGVSLFAGTGNDMLSSTGGSSVVIVGGMGNDTISLAGATNGVVVGGYGNSTIIQSGGSSITMFAGTGNDMTSSTGGSSIVIVGGMGNDTVSMVNVTGGVVVGGYGNATLTQSGGSSITMFAGAGNDMTSSTGGSSIVIVGGSGNDTLSLTAATSGVVQGGYGNSTLMQSGGSSITMFAGTGNDMTSSTGGSSIVIVGGMGNDTVSITGATNGVVVGGYGNSTLMQSGGSSITMFAGAGNDMTSSTGGSSIVIVGGTGNDTISLTNVTNGLVVGGYGNSNMMASGGSSITMFAGTGNDMSSATGGSSILIVGGTGNDTLSLAEVTGGVITGGTGNATLMQSGGSSITMFAGTGNDMTSSTGGSSIVIVGGSGNDTLSSTSDTNSLLLGGAGNNVVSQTGGSSITMFAGTGNDMASSTGGSSILIVGGTGNDTLSSSSDTGSALVGGAGNTSMIVTGGSSITMFAGTGNDMASATGGSSIVIVGGSGNDTLSSSSGYGELLIGGTGNTTMTQSGGSSITMFAGTGNDMSSSTGGSSIVIVGGSGNDTLSMSGGNANELIGGSGNTAMSVSGGSSITMFAGTGNDMSSATGGSSIVIVGGTGNDTLSLNNVTGGVIQGGYGNATLMQSGGSSITMFAGIGNDMTTSTGGSSIVIVGGTGNDTVSLIGDSGDLVVGGYGNSTVTISGGSSITMFAGTGNDMASATGGSSIVIVGGMGNDTLSLDHVTGGVAQGGYGNSTLTSTGGSSITMFAGTGNDMSSATGGSSIVIVGGTGNDTMSLGGVTGAVVVGGTGNAAMTATGGSSITMFAGTGNDMISATGGSSIVIVGGMGNDTLQAGADTDAILIGGVGNAVISQSGGSSVTMFGGAANDMISSTGGSSILIVGGMGNDTLTSTNDHSATLLNGGNGGDSIQSTGGSSISMFGGGGNDTLRAVGGADIGMYGQQGDNVYQIIGNGSDPISVAINDLATFGQDVPQDDSTTAGVNLIEFPDATAGITLNLAEESTGPVPTYQKVSSGISLAITGTSWDVDGTSYADDITGGDGNTVIDGEGGNDTLVGGAGSATIYAGTGNDSLASGSGDTTFVFDAGSKGSDTVSTPSGSNTLDFAQLGGGVTINLASSSKQTVASGLSLTLQNPGGITALDDTNFNDSVTGNARGDTFYLGTGSDSITGGGGADTFFFQGGTFGNDDINESSSGNTLNFYDFGQGISLSLQQSEAGVAQAVTGGSNGPTLTLSNPSAFSTVIGTPGADTIVGNATTDETIIGGGGKDNLQAGNGNDYVQGDVTQVVYLDFPTPTQTNPDEHIYTPLEQATILQGLEADFADYNFFFTLNQSTARQLAADTGGQYVTEVIDAPVVGGSADQLDPNNLNLGGTAEVNVTPFLGNESQGLAPPTSDNIIGLTTTIAAHELGHLVGLQHQDANGPIGAGIAGGINPSSFYPAYPAYPTTTTISSNFTSSGITFYANVTSDNPADGVPAGTVDFYDLTTGTDLTPPTNAMPFGGVTVVDGAATFTATGVSVGDVIIATFTSYSGYTTSSAAETVNLIPSTTTMNYNGYDIYALVTAEGGVTPTGTVNFYDTSGGNKVLLGSATLNYGQAFLYSYQFSQLPIPGDMITAVYAGDGSCAGSSSAASVTAGSTSISAYFSNYGSGEFLYVTVSANGSFPTGTVSLYDATSKSYLTASPVALNGYAQAQIYLSSFTQQPSGGDSLVVIYTSNSSSYANTSYLLLIPTTTTTTLSASGNTLTAVVSSTESGIPIPESGTVEFYDATTKTSLGSASLVNGTATVTANFSIGDAITATYQGGSGFTTSSGTQTIVGPSPTYLAVNAYGPYGYMFIHLTSEFGGQPTGYFNVVDETTGADLTPSPIYANQYEDIYFSYFDQTPSAGDVLQIEFESGSSAFMNSSAAVTYEPGSYTSGYSNSGTAAAPTTMSFYLASNYITAQVQSPLNYYASVGTVDFYDETTHTDLTPGGVALNDGFATFDYNNAPSGEAPVVGDLIQAMYSGATGYAASGAGITLPQSTASTYLSSSLASDGSSLVLTDNVSDGTQPTGAVDFYDATTGTNLSPGGIDLVNGSATLTTSAPAVGDVIIAVYSGDSNYMSTASSTTISQITTKTFLSSEPSANGQGLVLTAGVNTSSGITATGTVDFYDVTTNTDLGSAELSGGVAALTAAPAIGDEVIATFTGGGNGFFASSSAGLTVIEMQTTTTLAGTLELTATVSKANGGTVDFYDETTKIDLTPGGVALVGDTASTSVSLELANDDIVATYTDSTGATSTPTLAESFALTAKVNTFSGVTPAGTIDFYDATTGTDLTPGGVTLVNGSASVTLPLTSAGHSIIATYGGTPYTLLSNASQALGSDAYETVEDVMASPDSVGSTLLDAAGQTFFGERDAIALAFDDTGEVQQQQDLPVVSGLSVTAELPPPAIQTQAQLEDPYFTIIQAYVLGNNGDLPTLAVPNTLPAGLPQSGTTFDVTAVAVNATLAPGGTDFYTFNGQAGAVMTFQIISNTDTQNTNPILPELIVVGPDGQVIGYNVHEFESADSTILDVTLPTTGSYYIGVDSLLNRTAGNYQLFVYSFATSTSPSQPGAGDTLTGGNGNDTLVGSSGNDDFTVYSTGSNQTTIISGSGNDTINTINGANYVQPGSAPIATSLSLSTSASTIQAGSSVTFTADVTGANNSVPTGWVTFYDSTTQTDLGTVALSVENGNDQAQLSTSALATGDNTITAVFSSNGDFYYSYGQLTENVTTSSQATPTVKVTDAGGTFDGSAFGATATVAGTNGEYGSSLEGVTPTLSYYAGSTASGSALSGAPSSAGTYTVVAYFAGSTDYTSASAQTTFTITQATPTVNVSDSGGVYNQDPYAATATVTGISGKAGSSLEGVGITLDYKELDASGNVIGDLGSQAPTSVGYYEVIASYAGSTDYASASQSVTFNITPATLTVSGITAGNKVYDSTTTATLNTGSASLNGVYSGDSVTLVTTNAAGTFASQNVGNNITVTVSGLTLSGAQAGDYVLGTTTTTANITPATLTVSGITASNKVYDSTTTATLNTGSASLNGVYSGDSVTLVTTNAAGTFASQNVGNNITVTVSGLTLSGAQAGDYVISAPTTTANITPATLTVSGITAGNKVYDSTTTATLNTGSASLNGVYSGDSVTLVTTNAAGTFASQNVGNNITVTVSGLTLSGAQAGDYVLGTTTTTANITPATLTVSGITAGNKVYDSTTTATLNTGSASLNGVYSGDSVTLVTTNAAGTFASQNVGNNITVTVSGLTLSGAQAGDYVISAPSTTANITPATLTVSGITASNMVYDDSTTATLSTGNAALVGVYSGDSVTLSTAKAAGTFASKNVGNNITVTISGLTVSGAQAGDYVLSQPTTTANITPATLTVSGITASNKVYDSTTTATLNTSGAQLVGVYSGDSVTLSTTHAAGTFASQNVGSGITVTISGLTISGAQAGDYVLGTTTTTANITPATLTVSGITAGNKVYNANTTATLNTGNAALNGVYSGDSVTLVTTNAAGTFASKNVGNNITVTVSGLSLSGAQSGDYVISEPTTTANITPATLTVSANNASRVYGASNPTFSVSYSGFQGSDNSSVLSGSPTESTNATTTSAPGSYTISVTQGSLSAANYVFTFATGTLTITQDASTTSVSNTASGESVVLTATVTANSPGSGTPTGTVDFFDTTTNTDLGSVTLSGGKAVLSTGLLPGNQTITATYSGDANFTASSGTTSVSPSASIYVLSSSASGALTISGNAEINVPGMVDVNSKSATALIASSNAIVDSGGVHVVGGDSITGNAKFSPKPTTGDAAVADPLANLAAPSVSGTSNGAINVSGSQSVTINPGIYSSITVSGNGKLTMNPGIYVIAGGGFTVSGNGSVTGTGVMIYNCGSNYPGTGGTYGGITLSGTGTLNLTAPTTGPYAGIVIFQSRDNAKTITLSGNDVAGLVGSIYAPDAALSLSGNAKLVDALIVNTLTLTGNAILE